MHRLFMILSAGLLVMLPAWAGANPIPDLGNCTAVTAAAEPVSVYTLPDGGGDPLHACCAFGGAKIDASITLQLLDWDFSPISGVPAEDMWLESDGVNFCPGGAIADGDTDAGGITTWRSAPAGGAASQPEAGTRVMVIGMSLPQPDLDIRFHSPDLNGDRQVNLTDVVHFIQDYMGGYDWCSDFHWDGVLDLSDVVLLAQGIGKGCP
jgi:hypothetical protein